MFLDLFPGHLIGLVHDKYPMKKRCKEYFAFNELTVEYAKNTSYGMFFTPNGHGRVKNPKGTLFRWDGNVTNLNACFADFDKGTKEQQLATIRRIPVAPSAIVESKRGYHAYWFLKDTETTPHSISLWRRVQTTIAEKYGADTACSNPSRLMRLPGSWHMKGEPFLVTILEASNVAYPLTGLELAFPPKARPMFMPSSPRGMKRIEMPPIMALHEGDRHPTLKRIAGGMYANADPKDDYAIRQALKTWFSMSCINVKENWEREVDSMCDWLEKREFEK